MRHEEISKEEIHNLQARGNLIYRKAKQQQQNPSKINRTDWSSSSCVLHMNKQAKLHIRSLILL